MTEPLSDADWAERRAALPERWTGKGLTPMTAFEMAGAAHRDSLIARDRFLTMGDLAAYDRRGLLNLVAALLDRFEAASPRQGEPVDVERLAADGALYRVWDRVAALRLTGDWATRKRQVLDILAEERRNLAPEAKW